MSRVILTLAAVAVVLELAACGPAGSQVDEASGNIINGTPVVGDAGGVMKILVNGTYGSFECSAVTFRNRWILTAKHCVDDISGGVATPRDVQLWDLNGPWADAIELHPTEDVALVHFPVDFATANPLFAGTSQSLQGQALNCYGYGYTTYYGGGGTLHGADLTVTSWGRSPCGSLNACYASDGYRVSPNASGQIQWEGDSGSPCFSNVSGVRSVTGITSTAVSSGGTVLYAWQVGSDYFRDWAAPITSMVTRYPNSARSATWRGDPPSSFWSEPGNITGDDGAFSYSKPALVMNGIGGFGLHAESQYLESSKFGFDSFIPANATVNSVKIEFDSWSGTTSSDYMNVEVMVNGAVRTTYTCGVGLSSAVCARQITGLTRSDLLDSAFKVRMRYIRDTWSAIGVQVDFVRVTVAIN
jgi:hypothetical protein